MFSLPFGSLISSAVSVSLFTHGCIRIRLKDFSFCAVLVFPYLVCSRLSTWVWSRLIIIWGSCWRKPILVLVINRIILAIPIEVDAPRIANGIARHKLPGLRVVEPMPQQIQEARVLVPIPPLRPEPIVQVEPGSRGNPIRRHQPRCVDGTRAAQGLASAARGVEGVEGAGAGSRVIGQQAVGPEGRRVQNIAVRVQNQDCLGSRLIFSTMA